MKARINNLLITSTVFFGDCMCDHQFFMPDEDPTV